MGDGTDTQTIEVGEVQSGDEWGSRISLPVVELLTGRGFATGKSGSGKSNTASVVAERLLDQGYGLLIVDTDGEYYGLKETYEMLHVGGDEECDFQVSAEHAGTIADLALEENVPVILDVSSYIDESDAQDLLTAVARQLFAKEKKLKQPFLLVVEEVHEYIPEGGGLNECGRMLIKIGKRGRKHGLGILGISQRPADVKKDFITQCDWLVWHRLTWNNDTTVAGRILGNEYADRIERLDDGEAFVMTDWSGQIRQIQFDRKETFDAGATPGLDDFERPDLKSVNADLVSDLRQISEERERREDELVDLRSELEKKEKELERLRAELADARDLSEMADQFAHAMMVQARARARYADDSPTQRPDADGDSNQEPPRDTFDPQRLADVLSASDPNWSGALEADGGATDTGTGNLSLDAIAQAIEKGGGDRDVNGPPAAGDDSTGRTAEPSESERESTGDTTGVDDGFAALAGGLDATSDSPDTKPGDSVANGADGDVDTAGIDVVETDTSRREQSAGESTTVRALQATIRDLDPITREMLAHYRTEGPATPLEAHTAAGGAGGRTFAYDRNRRLREKGLIRHIGRGTYASTLARCARDRADVDLTTDELRRIVERIEEAVDSRGASSE